jgi:hypothetical protein
MQDMDTHERISFLTDTPRTGKLATVKPDGRPHITPIWFDLDGDTIIFTTWHTSVKAKNMRANANVCFCVDEEAPPFAYVIIEGTAHINQEAENLRYWTTRIAGRYMGEELAEEYGERNGVPGEYLVRIHPDKLIAKKNISE